MSKAVMTEPHFAKKKSGFLIASCCRLTFPRCRTRSTRFPFPKSFMKTTGRIQRLYWKHSLHVPAFHSVKYCAYYWSVCRDLYRMTINSESFVITRACMKVILIEWIFRLPPFSLIRDFGKQNTRRNVSKISVSLVCYWQIWSKSTNQSH